MSGDSHRDHSEFEKRGEREEVDTRPSPQDAAHETAVSRSGAPP